MLRPDLDPDRLQRLLDMRQIELDRAARAAFLAAFAELQAELPAATRGGTGHNNKKYARFEDVIGAVRPHLAAHGFSLSFRSANEGNLMRITGVLGHAAGHVEQTDILLPADSSGSKNSVQAMGSTISYGKRYVALSLLGIATEDDDDGRTASFAAITDAQAETIKDRLEATGGDVRRFCSYYKIQAVSDLPAARYDEAVRTIDQAGARRVVRNG